MARERFERAYLVECLKRHRGQITKAADAMRMHRNSLYHLIKKHDLDLGSKADGEAAAINLRAAREVADRKAIRQAMSRTDNNISGAAKLLGVSRPTLYDLLKQYRLQA